MGSSIIECISERILPEVSDIRKTNVIPVLGWVWWL